MQFSIQLYSLRNLVHSPADFLALFPKLKALGFDGVEFAGYHGLDAQAIRQALDAAGLVATGTHVPLDDLKPRKLPATIAFGKTLGLDMIGVGGAPHNTRREIAAACAVLRKAYQTAAAQGISIYYHNHMDEFKPNRAGNLPIEDFAAACLLQVDTCWSQLAGADNYAFLTAHRDRVCSVHIKDAAADHQGRALGEGIIDLDAVVRTAREIGLDWLVLEHENNSPGADAVAEIARCAAWLKEHCQEETL